ncbi:PREDICTED: cation/H(+) antiporter 15-like [Populus euphratica]|uniref:Cation/H(+) antiporter 15-like n=1 Tax=Populus euphratica TaxID=75702 RepID=A0AAJ6U2N1_POPEU|nr:PREDICTED: cation/H(+) antiporter 15-like [Populus euphratica]
MDLGIVKRAGRKPVVIGFLTFLFPVTLNLIVAGILSGKREMDPVLLKSIWHVAIFQAVTSFHVIVCLLADLKLVNSELGQLAISSSMISGMCSWGLVIVILFITELKYEPFWILLCPLSLIVLIFYVLRPLMVKMIAKTPEGKQVKEGYMLCIFIMVLGTAFLSEVLGHHVVFGATALGIAVPHGPPLGTALENKIESFVSSILLPSYFVLSVSRVDLLSIHSETVFVISMFGLTSFIGKVLGGMLPALFFKVPPVEAFSLGLLVDRQIYSMMVINMLFVSGTFTPVIKFLYDPSRHYKSSNKRTIHHISLNMEFRILAGIYHQDSTPCMIRLLEISNPTAKTPMCCYIVHLVQLVGSSSPLFMYHEPGATAKLPTKDCGRIINAFRLYEQESNGNVIVNLFTSISPFASIHEEVCRLAVEKRTSLVIIPFHMQWRLHGIEDITEARAVNRHILAKAPCSVGILVDRGTLSASKHHFVYKIGIIFVHGRDDREALAYGLRMAKHAKVSLTVIHLIDPAEGAVLSLDMDLDDDIITEFKAASAGKKRHSYITEFVKDSVELITLIRSVQNSYDLILVGRHHRSFSPIFMGLTEWNEFPELGFLGDVLASSDSQCQVSVLVVQQQVYRAGDRMNSAKNLLEDSAETVEIIFESTQGWKDIDISRHRMQPR